MSGSVKQVDISTQLHRLTLRSVIVWGWRRTSPVPGAFPSRPGWFPLSHLVLCNLTWSSSRKNGPQNLTDQILAYLIPDKGAHS